MARDKATQPNIDGSDLINYPNKRIRNNDGSGNGTPVDESVYGDIHELMAKIMRESKTNYNGLPDNTNNGYQLYDALMSLAGKNDLVKNLSQNNPTTLSIPVKINALKNDETIIFRALVDSTNAMNLIQGSDAVQKALVISGSFKNGDLVRMINLPTQILLVGLYDTQNAPNLITRLTNLENSIQPMINKLAVFQAGGGMVLWNKPAVLIPFGWHEVIDWRGRLPIGLDVTDTDIDVVGKTGGSKTKTLTAANNGPHTHVYGDIYHSENGGNIPVGGWGSGDSDGDNAGAQIMRVTESSGNGTPFNVMNPFRTVLFIEYTGV